MIRPKALGIVGASAVLVLGAAIGGPAIAADSGSAEPEIVAPTGGEHTRAATPQAVSGVSTGGACRMGYETNTNDLFPPGGNFNINPLAGSVEITKPCAGAVVGQFTSEIYTFEAGSFIHILMRATCTATGGFTGACVVGTAVDAAPGYTFLKDVPEGGFQTHSMNMVWPALAKGVWRFDVLAAGDGTAALSYRTFTVEAFKGG